MSSHVRALSPDRVFFGLVLGLMIFMASAKAEMPRADAPVQPRLTPPGEYERRLPPWRYRLGPDPHEHDHDDARHARHRGEVLPMAEILKRVARAIPGEVIAAEFERQRRGKGACWVYELKLITPNGRLLEVLVDAASGQILDLEDE